MQQQQSKTAVQCSQYTNKYLKAEVLLLQFDKNDFLNWETDA